MTNALALWDPSALGLTATPEFPTEKPLSVLVYGGSTATGTLAIQLLRLSGLEPVVTCSPRNFDLMRRLGTTEEVDYMRADVVAEIKKLTNNRLRYAYDCITDSSSVNNCYAAMRRIGSTYVSLEMVPEELRTRRAVRGKVVLGYEGLGKDVPLSQGYESVANPAKHALVVRFFRVFQKLLDERALKPHPIQMLEGGLAGVLEGLQFLKSGSVSGRKLVAVLDH